MQNRNAPVREFIGEQQLLEDEQRRRVDEAEYVAYWERRLATQEAGAKRQEQIAANAWAAEEARVKASAEKALAAQAAITSATAETASKAFTNLSRQTALAGNASKEAAVLFELESGALAHLTESQKIAIAMQARALDARLAEIEAEKTAQAAIATSQIAQTNRVKNALKGMGELSSKLKSFATASTFAITVPTAMVGAWAFNDAVKYDKYKKTLQTLTGSIKETDRQFKVLQKDSELPGLDFQSLIQGVVKLKSANFTFEQSRAILKNWGNEVALAGGSAEEFSRVVTNLGQISGMKSFPGDELRQMSRLIPTVRKGLIELYKTADTKQLAAMGISGAQAVKDLTVWMAGHKRAADSVQNDIKNLKNELFILGATVGKALIPEFKKFTSIMVPEIKGAVRWFDGLDKGTQSLIIRFATGAALIGPFAYILAQIITLTKGLIGAFVTLSPRLIQAAQLFSTLGITAVRNIAWTLAEMTGLNTFMTATLIPTIRATAFRLTIMWAAGSNTTGIMNAITAVGSRLLSLIPIAMRLGSSLLLAFMPANAGADMHGLGEGLELDSVQGQRVNDIQKRLKQFGGERKLFDEWYQREQAGRQYGPTPGPNSQAKGTNRYLVGTGWNVRKNSGLPSNESSNALYEKYAEYKKLKEEYAETERQQKQLAAGLKSLDQNQQNVNNLFKNFSNTANAGGDAASQGMKDAAANAREWKKELKTLGRDFGLSVSSEYRPGAKTHAKGTPSWHSQSAGKEHGLALDFAGDKAEMARFYDFVKTKYAGKIRELIYSPKGQVIGNSSLGYVRDPITRADHWNHVHVALKEGLNSEIDFPHNGGRTKRTPVHKLTEAEKQAKRVSEAFVDLDADTARLNATLNANDEDLGAVTLRAQYAEKEFRLFGKSHTAVYDAQTMMNDAMKIGLNLLGIDAGQIHGAISDEQLLFRQKAERNIQLQEEIELKKKVAEINKKINEKIENKQNLAKLAGFDDRKKSMVEAFGIKDWFNEKIPDDVKKRFAEIFWNDYDEDAKDKLISSLKDVNAEYTKSVEELGSSRLTPIQDAERKIARLFDETKDKSILSSEEVQNWVKQVREAAKLATQIKYDKTYNDMMLPLTQEISDKLAWQNGNVDLKATALQKYQSSDEYTDLATNKFDMKTIEDFWGQNFDLGKQNEQLAEFNSRLYQSKNTADQLASTDPYEKWVMSLREYDKERNAFKLPDWFNDDRGHELFNQDQLNKSKEAMQDITKEFAKQRTEADARDPFQKWLLSYEEFDLKTQTFHLLPGMDSEILHKIFEFQTMMQMTQEFSEGVKDIFHDMIYDISENGFKGMFSNIYAGFQQLLFKMAVEYLESQLYNMLIAGFTGLFGVAMGGATGANNGVNIVTGSNGLDYGTPDGFIPMASAQALTPKALGGDVMKSMAYHIHENGKEIFIPGQDGYMLNNGILKSLLSMDRDRFNNVVGGSASMERYSSGNYSVSDDRLYQNYANRGDTTTNEGHTFVTINNYYGNDARKGAKPTNSQQLNELSRNLNKTDRRLS